MSKDADADHYLQILEYGAWHGWGRSASGYRRDADHAEPGAQHGMALKVHRSREAAGHSHAGLRARKPDELHTLNVTI